MESNSSVVVIQNETMVVVGGDDDNTNTNNNNDGNGTTTATDSIPPPPVNNNPNNNNNNIKFRDCWLLFGGVNDVGFTHATNLGRLDIHRYLRAKYGNVSTFETVAYPNTFFMSELDRSILINKTISDGCNFIFAGSDNILNGKHVEYATQFPNISFGRMTGSVVTTNPINLVDYIGGWYNTSFLAGAVAATTSTSCAGFINAIETSGSAWSHAMGFAMGYHWVKPYQDVHIVTMDSYYNPLSEVLAATQLVEMKGCDVIGRHTDPNDVDNYILSLSTTTTSSTSSSGSSGRPYRALSMSRYVDMSTFVGDTVFSSQLINFFDYMLPSVESAFLSVLKGNNGTGGGPMYKYTDDDDNDDDANATTTTTTTRTPLGLQYFDMKLSPFTSAVDQDAATAMEVAAQTYLNENNPLCGARWKLNMELVVPIPLFASNIGQVVSSDSSTYDQTLCPNDITVSPISYLDLPNTTYYPSFQDGGVLCGGSKGGQYFTYNDDFQVTCHPCPENTFRLGEEGGRADSVCIACPNNTYAPMGSSLCREIIVEDLNQLGPYIRGYGFGLASVVVLTSIGFAIWVKWNETTRAVKASQPLFLHMLCFGTLLMGASIVPLAIDDALVSASSCNIACLAFPWLVTLGFSCTFSALYSKISRINQLFKAAKSFRRITIRERDVMKPFVILMSLNMIFLLLWTILDPPKWNRITISEGQSQGTCWSKWGVPAMVFCSLIAALNVSSVVLANYQAYQARTISDDLSESTYIGLAMGSILQIVMVGVPLIFLVWEDPLPLFFVMSSIVCIVPMSILVMIFIPKLLQIRENNRRERSTRGVGTSHIQTFSRQHTNSGFQSSTQQQEGPPATTTTSNTNARVAWTGNVVESMGDQSNSGGETETETASKVKRELEEQKLKVNKLAALLREQGINHEDFQDGDYENHHSGPSSK